MSKVIVCYKWVIDEADIRVNPDLTVDMSRAKYKISDYDKNTIEAGHRLAEAMGASPVGLSCGGEETRRSFPDALARGLDEGVWINMGTRTPTGAELGRLLSACVKRVEDAELVLCSEGSSDEYARQTGPRLAALLDWPVITSVVSVSVEDGVVTAKRKLEDSIQTVQTKLPAVLSLMPETAPAPIPGLRQVMMAKKKQVREYSPEDLGVVPDEGLQERKLSGYVSQRKNVLLKGDSEEETIEALVGALKKEGMIV